MEVRDKKRQSSQNAKDRSIKANKWPFSGTGAADILKTNYYVMVSADLFATTGFQLFYQEWILNIPYGKEKQLFVPSMEFEGISTPSIYRGMQILQYNGCNDYVSLFRNIKELGSWMFITGNERKMGQIIRAAKESGTYIRVYGLDQKGKLKNYRAPIKEQHKRNGSLSDTDIFSLPNVMSPIRKMVRKTHSVPGRGDIAYTSNHQLIRLGEEKRCLKRIYNAKVYAGQLIYYIIWKMNLLESLSQPQKDVN